jgi:hypothetical protein
MTNPVANFFQAYNNLAFALLAVRHTLLNIASEQAHIKNNTEINHRQKGRDNHTNTRKLAMVTLPAAQSNNHVPLFVGR